LNSGSAAAGSVAAIGRIGEMARVGEASGIVALNGCRACGERWSAARVLGGAMAGIL
jgi:hypothetical protein